MHAYDAHVARYELDDQITRVDVLGDEELVAADAVVIVTDHDDVDYTQVAADASYVFDTRHRLLMNSLVETL